MKTKIVDLRNFLERNKIFFEILAASALAITSIFVSFKANNIADQANIISKNQTKIMELENTPRIEIQRVQLYDDSTRINHVTKWRVFNNNSKISNFEIEKEFSFLNIVKKNRSEINIPLIEYLNGMGKLSGLSEGLIYEFDNKNCSQDEFLTRQGISDYGDADVKSYIQISYSNVLGKKGTKYFQILPLIQEISKDFWESVRKDWSNKNDNAIYLKDVEKNIQKIKKYN